MDDLDTKWKSYEAACVPAEAGPNQRMAMHNAFIGGAMGTLAIMAKAIAQANSAMEAIDAIERVYNEMSAHITSTCTINLAKRRSE